MNNEQINQIGERLNVAPPEMSLFQKVGRDRTLLMCIIIPLVFWGVMLYLQFFDPESAANPPDAWIWGVPLGATLLLGALFFFRMRKIDSVFEDGYATRGIVEKIKFNYKGRGYIRFQYEVDGEPYSKQVSAERNKRTKSLTEGDPLTVWYSPDNPKKVIVGELFADK